jgi:hypothetical protein
MDSILPPLRELIGRVIGMPCKETLSPTRNGEKIAIQSKITGLTKAGSKLVARTVNAHVPHSTARLLIRESRPTRGCGGDD